MRTARLKAPEHHEKAYYHCISRIVNRDFLLKDEEKEYFVSLMRTYETPYGLRVITYCIMSNHFHLLLEALREKHCANMWDLSAYMKMVKQRFTQWYNRREQRSGTLWYKSILVQGENVALKTMTAYIDLNPVHARMIDDPKY